VDRDGALREHSVVLQIRKPGVKCATCGHAVVRGSFACVTIYPLSSRRNRIVHAADCPQADISDATPLPNVRGPSVRRVPAQGSQSRRGTWQTDRPPLRDRQEFLGEML